MSEKDKVVEALEDCHGWRPSDGTGNLLSIQGKAGDAIPLARENAEAREALDWLIKNGRITKMSRSQAAVHYLSQNKPVFEISQYVEDMPPYLKQRLENLRSKK
jgi:hypothetical protein